MRVGDLFWVGLGGLVGSVMRYAVGCLFLALAEVSAFPVGTFIVNSLGCFLMGLLQGVSSRNGISSNGMLLLGVGFLGGFTTFSAFGWDWVRLVQSNRTGLAMTYALITVGAGFILIITGLYLGSRAPSSRG